jgi:hypothetical protein
MAKVEGRGDRANGALGKVELRWYEAHGIGKRDVKIKRYLDRP